MTSEEKKNPSSNNTDHIFITWLRWFLSPEASKMFIKFYATFFLISAFVATLFMANNIMYEKHLSRVESDPSVAGLFFLLYALVFTSITSATIFSLGLFRLKRWSLPILWATSVSFLLITGTALIQRHYLGIGEIWFYVIYLLITLCFGIITWFLKTQFSGPALKLWLQIPLILVVLLFTFLIVFSQYANATELLIELLVI